MSTTAPDLFGREVPAPLVVPAALAFTVHGSPAPAGSKSISRKGFVFDSSKRSRSWKSQVAEDAAGAMGELALFQGPLYLTLRFYLRRPQGHYSKRGGLVPSAPTYPTTKPDSTKLCRCVEDAMKGIVWRDDSQVVVQLVTKEYGPERVEITVQELT